MSTITDLGATTSVDVIARHLRLEGLRGVDVGCGDMTFTRSLAERGARMLAVDPDAIQAEKNRANGPIGNIEFREADAEALPVEDAALDAVFFSFSLHHVPTSIHAAVFDEAARVLRPDGALCVIEPADCPLNT
ncbi:MAG: class I SAM-dependent methyltransferase, partial [Planctomycetota bacterium]